jgi:hypothetical protein
LCTSRHTYGLNKRIFNINFLICIVERLSIESSIDPHKARFPTLILEIILFKIKGKIKERIGKNNFLKRKTAKLLFKMWKWLPIKKYLCNNSPSCVYILVAILIAGILAVMASRCIRKKEVGAKRDINATRRRVFRKRSKKGGNSTRKTE